jgi:hypothetical protein
MLRAQRVRLLVVRPAAAREHQGREQDVRAAPHVARLDIDAADRHRQGSFVRLLRLAFI